MLNDLDLLMTSESSGEVFYPNGLMKPDDKNNAERIRIDQPARKSTYKIRVKGTQLVEPQAYSLVITGCLASTATEETLAPTDIAPLPPTSSPIAISSPSQVPTRNPAGIEPTAGICADTQGTMLVEGSNRSKPASARI